MKSKKPIKMTKKLGPNEWQCGRCGKVLKIGKACNCFTKKPHNKIILINGTIWKSYHEER